MESTAALFENGELAHSIASILVGYEPENMKVNDSTHYWISGETALMKAFCLHFPRIAVNPTLPMIKEYLSLNDIKTLAKKCRVRRIMKRESNGAIS